MGGGGGGRVREWEGAGEVKIFVDDFFLQVTSKISGMSVIPTTKYLVAYPKIYCHSLL